jgi:outer membrane protein assembly factor BamB
MRATQLWIALVGFGIALTSSNAADAADWPQWMGPTRNGIWTEDGILTKFPAAGPKVLWRVPVAGGYSGPAVAKGRVYLTDYVTDADVRSLSTPERPGAIAGVERVWCFDAATGKTLWKHEYDCPYTISYPAGPRCTPTVAGDKVYTLGAEGHLICFDAASGKIIWSKDLRKEYKTETPIWGFTGHPLVDGDTLYCLVGGEGSLVVAFNKDTGREKWRALSSEETGYCPPTMIEAGGTKQLLLWDPKKINSLDPATGKLYWSVPLVPQYGMSIMGPQKGGDILFAGGIGGASVALQLDKTKPAVKELWRGTKQTAVHPVNSTPIIDGSTIYGVDETGFLRAVDLRTGKRLWETLEPVVGKVKARKVDSATAFLVKNGAYYYLFNEKGELVIAKLSPQKYEQIDRAKLLEPTGTTFGRDVVWSHPAYANRCIFARNDRELICVSLAAKQ